jgi:hypothetical protein
VKRSVSFIFEYVPSKEEQKKILERMEGLCEEMATVSVSETELFEVVIELEGKMTTLNENFETIFGKASGLQCEEKGKLREWKHECNYVDKIDFSSFLTNEESKTTLHYTLKLNTGEKINEESISSTVNIKKGEQSVSGNTYTCSVKGFYLTVTLSSKKWNTNLFTLLKAIVLLLLIVAAMIAITVFVKKLVAYHQNFD